MSIPREPRQKMINMMYLVLTAMLALNVSAEILNAFKTVNHSLETTNTTINKSTETIMASLDQKRSDPATAEKANYWYPKAKSVTDISGDVFKYIDNLKTQIMTEAGADPAKGKLTFKEDNLDVATRIMVEKGAGKKLYQMLDEYKKKVLSVDPAINAEFQNSLPIDLTMPKTQNKGNNTWEAAYFRMVPTVAALTMLSKFQNDVKTSENRIVAFCHNQVGQVAVRFDTYAAIIGQSSSYVLPNQSIDVTAGVGAFSKAAKPTITIGGVTVPIGEDGAAHQKVTGGSVGEHEVPVVIQYVDQEGKQQTIRESVKYTVGQSNAAVQLDKMNVLFIGVDNPVTVSGSGSTSQLKVSISGGGGSLSGSNGHYIARVNQETDECIVSVTTPDGKVTPVKFRVRSIPDPNPMVGQYESGDVPASYFKSQAGVRALVKNFFYETQFNVTGFRITGDGEGFADGIEEKINTGAAWKEAQSVINKCRPGSYIVIDNIRAVGPDGRSRKLSPLVFNLK
ncbi:MAG TPA: gliding motility protein GldM [Chitinophagaceae bacterium]|nr:gliding motility protein GldM [Chitinophagaceae bacterium]